MNHGSYSDHQQALLPSQRHHSVLLYDKSLGNGGHFRHEEFVWIFLFSKFKVPKFLNHKLRRTLSA